MNQPNEKGITTGRPEEKNLIQINMLSKIIVKLYVTELTEVQPSNVLDGEYVTPTPPPSKMGPSEGLYYIYGMGKKAND